MIRLDKYLADMGIGTRSEVKNIIRKKQVSVNGMPISKPEAKVDITKDTVCYQGKTVAYEPYVYYMLNKPGGCVSAVKDNLYPTVLSFIENPKGYNLFPVGRLDLDTEGLLLITNDGTLAHELLSPKKHVTKTYFAKVQGRVTREDVQRFSLGLDINEEKPTLPATLVIEKSDDISEIRVSITEGKYHQVKRMFEAVGKQVLFLKRLSMGTLQLDESLTPGSYRALTTEELSALKNRTI